MNTQWHECNDQCGGPFNALHLHYLADEPEIEEPDEPTLIEKMLTAIEAISLITFLVRPGNRTAELIRQHDNAIREMIKRDTEAPTDG